MELRQLEYLAAVVDEANFTRAADTVHVSQSGVSAQVRQLERELGVTLLDRSGRRVRPTAAGAALLPSVRAALDAVSAITRLADELAGIVRGRVSVGMVTGCTVQRLFDALADFQQRYPGVEVSLGEDASDRLLDGVRSGRFDLALLGTAGTVPADLASHLVADEKLVAAVPLTHPLAHSRTMSLPELVGHRLICLPRGSGVRAALDTACAAGGLTAQVTLEASAPDVVAGLAERGLGVAVLSETMASARSSSLHAVVIDGPLLSRLELAWRSDEATSAAARAFIDIARSAFSAGADLPDQRGGSG